MTMPTIRAATQDDLPAIVAIVNAAICDTTAIWTLTPVTLAEQADWMEKRYARGFPILVATAGDHVCGFGSYGIFRQFEGFHHTVEHSIYVEGAAQGRGIGTALLDALIAQGRLDGHHVMVGGIEATNARSIALHRRAGFAEAGYLRQVGRKFGRWLDLLFMQKIL
jgi:phosphinothricin acetyltransferase